MWWPSWLWIGTPFKFSLWMLNRFLTWTGLLFFWKRFRASRFVWAWIIVINVVSLGALGIVFLWLHHRSGP